MTIAYFLTFHDKAHPERQITEAEHARVVDIVRTTPRLARGLVLTPEIITGLYFDDGPPPQLAFELYFDDIANLEAALAPKGHLQALAAPGALPNLAEAEVTQQAMLARAFPVPDPRFRTPPGKPFCSYMVHYPGQAEDLNAWLSYYIENHAAIMARFPGIREIEIATRIDWCGFLPWPRVDYMQRNKVVFDDGPALKAALQSPVIKEMRADFHKFPPFTGGNVHFPMATMEVRP
jgi:uncharacterized protein (TIGR02118 family)